jgi:hypothetical protein
VYSLQLLRDILSPAYRQKQIWVDSFYYNANWNLGASAINAPAQIQIDADADFVITYSILAAYSAPGTIITAPDYLVTFMDTGSGRNFQNVPVHVQNVFGTAERPFAWPEPKLITAASTLNLQLTNRTTQTATVQATLGGLKIFYFSGFTRSQLGVVPFGAM